jgi:hypothetical protein
MMTRLPVVSSNSPPECDSRPQTDSLFLPFSNAIDESWYDDEDLLNPLTSSTIQPLHQEKQTQSPDATELDYGFSKNSFEEDETLMTLAWNLFQSKTENTPCEDIYTIATLLGREDQGRLLEYYFNHFRFENDTLLQSLR